MKKSALTTTISILLIVASLFALIAAGFGVKDGLAIKQYKEEDAKAADVVGDLEKAIGMLKENEAAYLEGVGTYAKGLSDYAAGQKAYNEGKATLAQGYKDYDEGKATLAQGYKDYAAGKKALEEGRAKVAAGQAMIDANTDAYNEGKALLAKIEPLMPLLNTYVKFRDGSIAKLPGFDSAQAWFVGKVAPIAERLGLSIPADVTDFPAYVQNMVAEGKAMLKQYEDGLKELEAGKAELAAGEQQLAEAEKQLAQGEKDLAAGKKALEAGESELAAGAKELADGAAQLEAGRNDLEAFESGMALVDEYTMVCFKNEPIYRHNGDMAVPGPEQRLGSDFDWKKYDENGNLMTLRTGEPYLDLDQCLVVCKSFRESVDHAPWPVCRARRRRRSRHHRRHTGSCRQKGRVRARHHHRGACSRLQHLRSADPLSRLHLSAQGRDLFRHPANNCDNHLCACRARLPYRDRRSKERGRKAGRRSLKILIFRAL